MANASQRRKNKRTQFLAHLAATDPKRFRAEWSKRLASWAFEAKQRAGRFSSDRGNPLPTAFAVLEEAHKELRGCGPSAIALEGRQTSEVIGDECSKSVAAAVDPKMHVLSRTLAVCKTVQAG
jgi:hypothetical protein